MSLTRAALLKPRKLAISSAVARRSASSSAHDDHHHYEDNTVYPQESFVNKTWRNWTLGGLAVALFYKLAPTPGEESYLTRWITMYSTDQSVWEKINQKHLVLSAEAQVDTFAITDAKRPTVHRYKYPQRLEQHSTHMVPVGTGVDLSDVVVKNDKS